HFLDVAGHDRFTRWTIGIFEVPQRAVKPRNRTAAGVANGENTRHAWQDVVHVEEELGGSADKHLPPFTSAIATHFNSYEPNPASAAAVCSPRQVGSSPRLEAAQVVRQYVGDWAILN